MNEPRVKIPGTTYSLQFGTEGKYYAVSLVHGRQAVKSKQLDILKGTSLDDLPEELENGMKFLLESENLYISPVIVDRVVNEILEGLPEEGDKKVVVEDTDKKEDRLVPENVSVKELIKQSESRAEKKSIIEHQPAKKPKYDASADTIGNIKLPKPKPLPQKEKMVEREESQVTATAVINEPRTKEADITETYEQLQSKIDDLTNEVQGLEETITKNKNQITSLKRQITILKKKIKEITE